MLSYHADQAVKSKYLSRVIAHREADEIVHGKYWEDGKGCAVGCTIHSSDHNAYETELGLPVWLARLEDTIFEGLTNGSAQNFPQQFLEAIPVSVDLTPVKWKFCAFILRENIERVLALDISEDLKKQVVNAARGVLAVHEAAIESGEWNEAAGSAAWSAARSAVRSAAESAPEPAAWSAADSAAWSARSTTWSARSAARSAAESTADSTAWSARSAAAAAESESESVAAYERYRDELLRLLREAR